MKFVTFFWGPLVREQVVQVATLVLSSFGVDIFYMQVMASGGQGWGHGGRW